jgi:O-antigen ligase
MRSKAHALIARAPGVYWNLHLSRKEAVLLASALVAGLVLHLSPVMQSGVSKPLLFIMACLCFLNPFTAFFFIGCSSILPFPDAQANELFAHGVVPQSVGADSTSPALIGAAAWFVMTLVRYRRFDLRGFSNFWPVLPWLLLMGLLGVPVFQPTGEYAKDIFYVVIACQQVNEARGQHLKCFLGLCLGALVASMGYWGWQAGLPIDLSDFGNARGEFARLGGVRADSVGLWPPLLMGGFGLLGLLVATASRLSPVKPPRWLLPATAVLFVASIPPLLSTMTHGAYMGLVLMLVAFVLFCWNTASKRLLSGVQLRKVYLALFVIVISVTGLFVFDAFGLRSRTLSLFNYYGEVSQEQGLAASRSDVWQYSLRTIAAHPLGVLFDHAQEEIPPEYAPLGFYLSHNVFLDIGRGCGVLGMLAAGFFFLWPFCKMWSSGEKLRYLPFLLSYVAVFILWMSLSFVHYKISWALWMLMAMAVIPRAAQARATRRRPRTVTKAVPVPALARVAPRPVGRAQGGPIEGAV